MKLSTKRLRTGYSTAILAAGFLSVSLFLLSAMRFFVVRVSGGTFVHDAQVWKRVGDGVLAGKNLYSQVPDNKPPLWEGLVVVATATPVPYLVLLCFVGLGSAVVAWSVFNLTQTHLGPRAGVIAVVSVAFGILVMTQGFINNKIPALALLFAGLSATDSKRTGLAYGAATLIAQQILVALPAIYWWERAENGRELANRQMVLIAGTWVVAYVGVGVLWGVDSIVAGVEQTILLGPAYAVAESQFHTTGSPWSTPTLYADQFLERAPRYAPLYVLGVVGIGRQFSDQELTSHLIWLSLFLMFSLGMMLTVRMYRHYWLLILPELSIVAAFGAEWFLNEYAYGPKSGVASVNDKNG